MNRESADLDLTPAEMRSMTLAVLERAICHVESLGDQPACGDLEGLEALCRALRAPPPLDPVPLEPLLDRFFDQWLPRSLTTPGPGYLAYIPGGGLFPAALADLLQGVTNRYTGVWQAAPLLVQLEANVLDWFREWMQFPSDARGVLTTGGSMANFNAIVCARERLLGAEIRRGVMYASTQAHHSVQKSARLAGIAADRLRFIEVDTDYRMRVAELRDAIRDDRRRGLQPFLAVSSAGTTNTGAVDPLSEIADACAEEGLWHHVDGAYGAFFHACESLRPLLAGLPRADSLTLDPHKGLFLPYGTGALLVRDGSALRSVHRVTAAYMPAAGPDEFYDPSQFSPELSRGFPGLRVWLCLQAFGLRKIQAAIAEKRELALEAASQVASLPDIHMAAPPQLSLFAFHMRRHGATLEEENRATQQLLHRVCARGRVMLTGCTPNADGRFLGRVCVLCFRTRRDRMQTCVEHIAEESRTIAGQTRW